MKRKAITLNSKQVKALETLLDYIGEDECEHFWTTSQNPADHIWASIRELYMKVFGKRETDKLEKNYQ